MVRTCSRTDMVRICSRASIVARTASWRFCSEGCQNIAYNDSMISNAVVIASCFVISTSVIEANSYVRAFSSDKTHSWYASQTLCRALAVGCEGHSSVSTNLRSLVTKIGFILNFHFV
ncbi:hypothetical protein ACOSQ3_004313 [Xanthoceras sorbifolium]